MAGGPFTSGEGMGKGGGLAVLRRSEREQAEEEEEEAKLSRGWAFCFAVRVSCALLLFTPRVYISGYCTLALFLQGLPISAGEIPLHMGSPALLFESRASGDPRYMPRC